MPFYGHTLADTTKILQYVQSGQVYDLKMFIRDRNYSKDSLNQMLDSYKNNLLHIATLKNDFGMIEYLLEFGLDFTLVNAFGQTAWDIAILLRNDKIINTFVSQKIKTSTLLTQKLSELQTKIKNLERENGDFLTRIEVLRVEKSVLEDKLNKIYSMESENSALLYKNKALTTDNKKLSENLSEMRTKHARALDDNSELERSNKKLRTENTDLLEKNRRLKISVDNLINNARK